MLILIRAVLCPKSNKILGLDLLKHIRYEGNTVPVIILTARGDEDDRIRGLRLGADDYVVKPFNPRILLARVRAAQRMIMLRERVEESEFGRFGWAVDGEGNRIELWQPPEGK